MYLVIVVVQHISSSSGVILQLLAFLCCTVLVLHHVSYSYHLQSCIHISVDNPFNIPLLNCIVKEVEVVI